MGNDTVTNLGELLEKVTKELFNGTVKVVYGIESSIGPMKVVGYKCGTIFRIDIKPGG